MTYGEKAKNLFFEGYNCAQSVVLAFKDKIDLKEEKLKLIASGLGGGIARLRETCGCITGMAIVLGLINGKFDKDDVYAKGAHYADIQELSLNFKEKFKTYYCNELLHLTSKPSSPIPGKRDEHYYKSHPCGKFIEYMANELAKKLDEK